MHPEKRHSEKVVIEYVYEIDNHVVGLDEVCAGLQAKTLRLVDGGDFLAACNAKTPVHVHKHHQAHATVVPTENGVPTSSKTDLPLSTVSSGAALSLSATAITTAKVADLKPSDTLSLTTPAFSIESSDSSSLSLASPYVAPPSYRPSDSIAGSHEGQGLDRDFPDGEIDCTDFPSDYGPIEIEWMGIGGWSGIQYPTYGGDSIVDIVTAVPGGDNCTANAMCSYACPPGYQKSQWPTTQGSTGQSVGGLQCNQDGKLTLTNPSLSRKLCIKGTGATQVQNKLSKNAAICRTDYPGWYLIPMV